MADKLIQIPNDNKKKITPFCNLKLVVVNLIKQTIKVYYFYLTACWGTAAAPGHSHPAAARSPPAPPDSS